MSHAVLFLTAGQRRLIEAAGAAAYPEECCGIILGRDVTGAGAARRVVEELHPVVNDFDTGERHHRFSIPAATLMAAERNCTGGRVVLGFYHSHPDHPARPSEYDRAHAWPFYSYVIVSIEKGRPVDLTSWVLDEGTGRFEEQPVQS